MERVNKLVKQLGDKDYYVRQRAQEELARTGFAAFDALSAATTDEDLESVYGYLTQRARGVRR